jgi:HEAT repeat protein
MKPKDFAEMKRKLAELNKLRFSMMRGKVAELKKKKLSRPKRRIELYRQSLEAFIEREKIEGELAENLRMTARKKRKTSARGGWRDWEYGRKEWRGEDIARLNSKKAIAPLLVILKRDPDMHMRINAAKALGLLKAKPAVRELIKLLEHRKGNLAMNAALALGRIGDKRALEPLVEAALKGKSKGLKGMAVQALAKMQAVEELLELKASTGLIEILKNENETNYVRALSALALAQLKAKKAVEPLQALAKDFLKKPYSKDNAQFRLIVCRALILLGETRHVKENLLKVSETNILDDKLHAFDLLADIGEKEVVRKAFKWIYDPDERVQQKVGVILGKYALSSATPETRRRLQAGFDFLKSLPNGKKGLFLYYAFKHPGVLRNIPLDKREREKVEFMKNLKRDLKEKSFPEIIEVFKIKV